MCKADGNDSAVKALLALVRHVRWVMLSVMQDLADMSGNGKNEGVCTYLYVSTDMWHGGTGKTGSVAGVTIKERGAFLLLPL